MNLTEREKLLLPILPAVLIFAVYTWTFGASAQSRMTEARNELAALEQDAAGAGATQQIWMQRSRLKKLQQSIEEARARSAGLRRQADELTGVLTAGRREIDAVDAVTSLLRRHRLMLEEESPALAAETAGMAASLEEATRTLEQATAAGEPASRARTSRSRARVAATQPAASRSDRHDTQFRRLRFYGRFTDVLAALEELARTDDAVVAVGLEMDEIGPDGLFSPVRRWTLWIRV
ncbi:MAG: hypothetical protein ACOCWL_01315 [Thermoguttaceae bacterium]